MASGWEDLYDVITQLLYDVTRLGNTSEKPRAPSCACVKLRVWAVKERQQLSERSPTHRNPAKEPGQRTQMMRGRWKNGLMRRNWRGKRRRRWSARWWRGWPGRLQRRCPTLTGQAQHRRWESWTASLGEAGKPLGSGPMWIWFSGWIIRNVWPQLAWGNPAAWFKELCHGCNGSFMFY